MKMSKRDASPPRSFKDVPTYNQRQKKLRLADAGKKYKHHTPKSRKRFRLARRAPVRDSKRAYRILFIQTRSLFELSRPCTRAIPPTRYPKTAQEAELDVDEDPFHGVECEVNAEPDTVDLTSETSDEDVAPAQTSLHEEIDERGESDYSEEEVDDVGFVDVQSDETREERDSPVEVVQGVVECEDHEAAVIVVDLVSDEEDEDLASEEEEEDDLFGTPAPWSADITRMWHTEHPEHIQLPDSGSVDWWGCIGSCEVDVCINIQANLFCSSNNCLVGSNCGNRRRE